MVRPFTVYRIRVLEERFQTCIPDDPAGFRARWEAVFSGRSPVGDCVETLRCHIDDPRKPAGDFAALFPGTFVFLVDPHRSYRTNVIAQVLFGCETLPVAIGTETRYAVNPPVSNALDHANCHYETDADGRISRIQKYAFHRGRIDWNVFRIPETADREVFTYTGSPEGLADDPDGLPVDDELVLGCEKDCLTGLEFETVWISPAR